MSAFAGSLTLRCDAGLTRKERERNVRIPTLQCRFHRHRQSKDSFKLHLVQKQKSISMHSASSCPLRYPGPSSRTWSAMHSTCPISVRAACNHYYPWTMLTIHVVQLHNSLIISLFDFTVHRRPPTPPPDVPKHPPRKRKRTLPYQGPDDTDGTLRSRRLKRWTVSLGQRERERIRNLQSGGVEHPRPRKYTDEISADRGVVLLTERGGTSILYTLVLSVMLKLCSI